MKAILLLPLVAVLTMLAFANDPKDDIKEPKTEVKKLLADNPLRGMWRLVQHKKAIGNRKLTKVLDDKTKFFGDKNWNTTHRDAKSGVVSIHTGGTYKIEDDIVSETIQYSLPNTKHLIGETNRFTFKLVDGKLHFKGLDRKWDEVWERVE